MRTSKPKPRRARWAPARRKARTETAERKDDSDDDDPSFALDAESVPEPDKAEESLLQVISRGLWQTSYEAWFQAEVEYNRQLLGRGSAADASMQRSQYARRLRGDQLAAWRRRQLNRERDQLAIELRSANMRQWSPSIVARSISYFHLTTSWQHQVESGQRRLASRPTTFKVLRMMRDAKPEPEWDEGLHVCAFVFDQTYEWVGMAKRGRRQAVETVDATGMPMAITHEVYVNAVQLRLPAIFATLSTADLAAIANNHGSPYTEEYECLYDWLRPSEVRGYLQDFSADALASVQAAVGARRPDSLSLREVADALFGRRSVDPGGPSEFDILEALMRCDTKSYEDATKILYHLSGYSHSSAVVDIAYGDGQSVITLKNLKKRFPDLYARWLIGVGGFHEHAHTMFALNEMFFEALVKRCLEIVGITKVFKITKDLEHNNYAHVQQAHHVITTGIVAYLVQDVQDPPPSLFLRNPELYLQQVECATGIVLVKYLQYAGFPILQWQRAAREGDGLKLKKLFAYSHYAFRSVSHKPVCAQVSLIALLGFCCALPSLQTILMVTVSVSLLGRCGANMYVDRLLEYINKIQQGSKRSAHAASFGRAIDMTTLLRSIMHVRHAFQAAETGATESDDGMKTNQLIMARLLQDYLVKILGRDLTVRRPLNELWHTGNAVPLDTGDFRTRRPWEWIWRVAFGRSAGKWRATNETWLAYASRFVTDKFFKY